MKFKVPVINSRLHGNNKLPSQEQAIAETRRCDRLMESLEYAQQKGRERRLNAIAPYNCLSSVRLPYT